MNQTGRHSLAVGLVAEEGHLSDTTKLMVMIGLLSKDAHAPQALDEIDIPSMLVPDWDTLDAIIMQMIETGVKAFGPRPMKGH